MNTKKSLLIFSLTIALLLACQLTSKPLIANQDPSNLTSEATVLPTSALTSTPVLDNIPVEIPNAEVVLVPEGEFIMGSNDGYQNETPAHTVYLDKYYIDKYEVTNLAYKSCVDAGICDPPTDISLRTRAEYYGNPEFDNFPVVYVDWNMAVTFCQWRGANLPTEAQWEKAARGADGRTFPWGEGINQTYANYNVNLGNTSAVGSYEKGISPYGVYDMTGNVDEWVADWYSEIYYENSPLSNPQGPGVSDRKVSRGGSWSSDYDFSRTTFRYRGEPSFSYVSLGFRCARNP